MKWNIGFSHSNTFQGNPSFNIGNYSSSVSEESVNHSHNMGSGKTVAALRLCFTLPLCESWSFTRDRADSTHYTLGWYLIEEKSYLLGWSLSEYRG